MKTITLTLTENHYGALMQALELAARCGVGQFGTVAELFSDRIVMLCDASDEVEKACKSVLTPELGRHAYHGISSDSTPATSKRCWEIYSVLHHAIDPRGVWQWEPMPCSGDAMPVCVVKAEETP